MQISIIAAVARNNAIGFRNQLLYRLPADMKRFKALTTGHTVIMGRKTFDSLPKGALPNRRNIVLTRSKRNIEGCECFASIDEALKHCASDEQIFIMGGAEIYRQTIGIANRLCLTEVTDTPEHADTFFPSYADDWQETWREEHDADDRHAVPFAFVDYIKKEEK